MSNLRSDLRADLKADVLADLAPAEVEAPVVVPEPVPVPADRTEVTPVVSMQVTPMRWSRPRVVTVNGTGKAVRVGPLSFELNVKP
jgi:hypothetical protein